MFRKANRKRALRLLGALILYFVVLAADLVAAWLGVVEPGRVTVLTVAHLVAALLLIIAFAVFYLRTDELQKSVQQVAMSIALGGVAVLTTLYGFLESFGLPRISWTYVFPLLAAFWFIGAILAERRYE